MRLAFRLFLIALLMLAAALPAAAGDICSRLSAELASLGRSNVGASKAARYATSAAKQQAALDRALDAARRGRCKGGFLGLGRAANCDEINSKIAEMRANLASLKAVAGRGGDGLKARRAEIRNQMASAGCKADAAPVQRKAEAGTGTARTATPVGGGYRTLCVRLCDGYYFPMAWSSGSQSFAAQEKACAAQCPGSATALYVHRTGAESDSAVSLTGEPYGALANAYLYRTKLDPACGCRAVPPASAAAAVVAPAMSLRTTLDLPVDLPVEASAEPAATAEPVRRVGPPSLYVQ